MATLHQINGRFYDEYGRLVDPATNGELLGGLAGEGMGAMPNVPQPQEQPPATLPPMTQAVAPPAPIVAQDAAPPTPIAQATAPPQPTQRPTVPPMAAAQNIGPVPGMGPSVPMAGNGAIPEQYAPHIYKAAEKYGVPVHILAGLFDHESGWNPVAKGTSGEIGLGQFMPDTAKQFGVDPSDPIASIDASARYLAQGYKQTGSWEGALGTYNRGFAGDLSKAGPYVSKVMAAAAKYGGDGSAIAQAARTPGIFPENKGGEGGDKLTGNRRDMIGQLPKPELTFGEKLKSLASAFDKSAAMFTGRKPVLEDPADRAYQHIGSGVMVDRNTGKVVKIPGVKDTTLQDIYTAEKIEAARAKRNAPRVLPQRLQDKEVEDVSTYQLTRQQVADVDEAIKAISTGKIAFDLGSRAVGSVRTAVNAPSDSDIDRGHINTIIEKMRNAALVLNKGVQTEGDAQRALKEIHGITENMSAETLKERFANIKRHFENAARRLEDSIKARRSGQLVDDFDFDTLKAPGTTFQFRSLDPSRGTGSGADTPQPNEGTTQGGVRWRVVQ